MKIVPPEPAVDLYTEGFEEDDILQRKRTGDALSSLVNLIEDPLVVALDGSWGTGKTYFLKRWAGAHEGALVVHFDAFEHDFVSDPLPALVSALEERLTKTGTDDVPASWKDSVPSLKEAAFKMAKPLARVVLKSVGAGIVVDAADEFKKIRDEEAEDRFEDFWKAEEGRRAAMKEFRTAVETLAIPSEAGHEGATLIFLVDELDRCRPEYALEVIEVIKHLFSVPRVHFVLGVNLKALEAIVRARYGPKFDAQRYLGKFIQVRLALPDEVSEGSSRNRTMLAYLDWLVREMGVPQYIRDPLRQQIELVDRATPVSLRDVGSIVSSVSLASSEVVQNPANSKFLPGWIEVMNTLIISSTVRDDLYEEFLQARVGPKELESYFGTDQGELRTHLDEKQNPNYKREVSFRYHMWLYLSQNDRLNEYEHDFLTRFPGQFSSAGFVDDPKVIPMNVHRQWLDRFSFYKPDQH